MKDLIKILIVFLCITGGSTILMNVFDVDFGTDNYWESRGVFFLFFITLFPRLTLLFSSVASGGFLWWLAWLFSPRLLVAVLATITYWQSNPILVVISWLVALGGETSEKTIVFNKRTPFRFKKTVIINGRRTGFPSEEETQTSRARYNVSEGDVFEADYEVKKD